MQASADLSLPCQLKVPSTDKDTLFRELREAHLPETAKAIVDDCYLGYIRFSELQQLLEEFSSGRTADRREGHITASFTAILAECFACRDVDMINLATEYLKAGQYFATFLCGQSIRDYWRVESMGPLSAATSTALRAPALGTHA